MKLEYTLLLLAIGLLYGIIKQFLPDFPIDEPTLIVIVLYVLAKLGVEIVGAPVRAFLQKRGLIK